MEVYNTLGPALTEQLRATLKEVIETSGGSMSMADVLALIGYLTGELLDQGL